jgi:hypothetical protein
MALPPLYVQNLTLNARRDVPALNAYKVGLIEAILKDTLRMLDEDRPIDDVRASVRTALDVAVWTPPRGSPRTS